MIARRLYRWIGLCAIVVAGLLLGAGAIVGVRHAPGDLGPIVAAIGLAVVLGWLHAPIAAFERSPFPQPKAERVALLLPLLIWLFAVEGWWVAAVANVAALLVRPLGSTRRTALIDRFASGAFRVLLWFGVGSLARWLLDPRPPVFIALGIAWYVAANLVLLDPLTSLRTGRRLATLWRARLRDAASLLQVAGEVTWGWAGAAIAATSGPWFALATFVPLAVIAAFAVALARTRARLHRSTLSRAAVEAMLAAADPLPQIRSLLVSVDARLAREALEVYGFDPTRRAWSRIVRLGTVASTPLRALATVALDALTLVDGGSATQRSDDGLACAVPIRDAEVLVGAIVVYRVAGAHAPLPESDLQRAAAELGPVLGDYATIEATRSAATFDALTGLANRRTVGRAIDEAMAHVRAGGSYAVLLLDLDHFKSINDLLGHQEGDRVLAAIGRIVGDNVREGDLAGRFGGEEFIVLLRDASRERALLIAERLRTTIAASGLAYADGAPLTVSVGVAYARTNELARDVIERADRALYRAKNAGRNRVVEASSVA